MLYDYGRYYQPRQTEDDFCRDFPGDEILIDGLHAMQCHFWNHNIPVEIPVVRLMNAVHYLAAYMLSTQCSGDQLEYDVLATESLGKERKLIPLVMIVLAALLKRTEGFRATHCREVILSDRSPDFEEGVTLYDRFLRSAEKHFAEEDFLIDTHNQILQLQEENTRLVSENIQLKYTITKMENQQNNQYLAPVYQGCTFTTTTNNYYQAPAPAAPKPECSKAPQDVTPETDSLFCCITQAAYDKGAAQQVENELRSACKVAPKLVKAIKTNEALGYLDTKNLSSKELYDLLNEHFGLSFEPRNFRYYRSK